MPTDELAYADIAEIAPRIRAGEITATQLTEGCLARIDQFDGRISAFITLLADSALAQVRQLDAERSQGAYRGPLHGIPVAHKDLYYRKGVRTTAGSKILADFVPEHNATAVSKLEAAGMVLLGKVGLHEFALGGTNDNPHYGAVHNPWDLARIPGGSSGGSAVAPVAGHGVRRVRASCLTSTGISGTPVGLRPSKPNPRRVSPTPLAA